MFSIHLFEDNEHPEVNHAIKESVVRFMLDCDCQPLS
jgi:hypothetical protein